MMTYFGTSLETAQMYASYLKRRDSGCHEFVVIRLCIPDAAFQNLDSTQLVHVHFPSDDWKKLVWHCRTSRSSNDFDRFDKASVIVGNVACKSDQTFRELESWEDVSEEHVLGLESHGGQAEVQYAFSCHRDGMEFLAIHATDIEILRYSDREYWQWMEERKNEESSG
jgi:hypothetical protein